MTQIDNAALWEALKTVIEPELGRDIVSLNMVKDVSPDTDGRVAVTIELTTPACPLKAEIEGRVTRALMRVPGVRDVQVIMTSNVTSALGGQVLTPGIRNIIGVASAKGGVGKSTVAVNLAVALANLGARVGLLDADIYGPNVPIMMGLRQAQPEIRSFPTPDGEFVDKLMPVENYGVKVMSMGFLIDEDQPVIWRGPMLNSALRQFLAQVAWDELDYLLVDLPPGTGDVQISLIQLTRITGIVQVTTPQEVALQDVRKGIVMFRSQKIPLLGIIENMSSFLCPHCHQRSYIFSHGGAREVAEQYGVPFLGEIPLVPQVRECGDNGIPIVAAAPESDVAKSYRDIASRMAAEISMANAARLQQQSSISESGEQ